VARQGFLPRRHRVELSGGFNELEDMKTEMSCSNNRWIKQHGAAESEDVMYGGRKRKRKMNDEGEGGWVPR
jgi:hypothetical protein